MLYSSMPTEQVVRGEQHVLVLPPGVPVVRMGIVGWSVTIFGNQKSHHQSCSYCTYLVATVLDIVGWSVTILANPKSPIFNVPGRANAIVPVTPLVIRSVRQQKP